MKEAEKVLKLNAAGNGGSVELGALDVFNDGKQEGEGAGHSHSRRCVSNCEQMDAGRTWRGGSAALAAESHVVMLWWDLAGSRFGI